uniref:Uncharacterized protein n=1 Tax=Oryza glumipatula TaxID=40148 RepID=A0A0E0A2V0_9ORYZ
MGDGGGGGGDDGSGKPATVAAAVLDLLGSLLELLGIGLQSPYDEPMTQSIRVRGAKKQRKVVDYSYNTGYSRSTAQCVCLCLMIHPAKPKAKHNLRCAGRRHAARGAPHGWRNGAGACLADEKIKNNSAEPERSRLRATAHSAVQAGASRPSQAFVIQIPKSRQMFQIHLKNLKPNRLLGGIPTAGPEPLGTSHSVQD